MPTSIPWCLVLVALAGLATAAPGEAGEVCLDPADEFGCFPCDLPTQMSAIGYSLSGPPCESPAAGGGPGEVDHPGSRGWWTGLWTLSASDQDPFVNSGPFLTEESLHLWLVDSGCGYGHSGNQIAVTSDFRLESYEPATGSQTWNPSPDRLAGLLGVSLGCQGGGPCYPNCPPVLVGTFHVSRVRSESVPVVEPSTWMSLKSRWRSEPPEGPANP